MYADGILKEYCASKYRVTGGNDAFAGFVLLRDEAFFIFIGKFALRKENHNV